MDNQNGWQKPQDIVLALRCTNYDSALSLLEDGKIKFNTPESWVKWAESHEDKRGDKKEGTIAACLCKDSGTYLAMKSEYSKKEELVEINVDGCIYFKRKKTMSLPAFCFYGLKVEQFEIPKNPGWQHLKATVPETYFKELADNMSQEEVDRLPDDEKPCCVVINNVELFIERICAALKKLGLEKKEILIDMISYENMSRQIPFEYNGEAPSELFIKDVEYAEQNEIRIVVNTKKENIRRFLVDNVIYIGSLSDIAKIMPYTENGIDIEGDFDIIGIDSKTP